MALLELKGITAGYGQNVILRDFNLNVERGDCVAAGSAGGLRAESVQFQGQGRDQDGVLVPGADSVHRARFHHAALCGQPV